MLHGINSNVYEEHTIICKATGITFKHPHLCFGLPQTRYCVTGAPLSSGSVQDARTILSPTLSTRTGPGAPGTSPEIHKVLLQIKFLYTSRRSVGRSSKGVWMWYPLFCITTWWHDIVAVAGNQWMAVAQDPSAILCHSSLYVGLSPTVANVSESVICFEQFKVNQLMMIWCI